MNQGCVGYSTFFCIQYPKFLDYFFNIPKDPPLSKLEKGQIINYKGMNNRNIANNIRRSFDVVNRIKRLQFVLNK